MIAVPLSKPAVRPFPISLLHAARHLSGRWSARRRQRLDLAELDDHLLRDIGVTRREARCECARPFWR